MLTNTHESLDQKDITVSLYNWSLPWVGFMSITSGAIAIAIVWLGFHKLFLPIHLTESIWLLPLGASTLLATYCLYQYYGMAQEYVAKESDDVLIKTLHWLGIYWYGLAAALIFATARFFSTWIPVEIDGIEGGVLPIILMACLVSALLLWKLKIGEKEAVADSLSLGIRNYGVRVVRRVKLCAHLSIFLGIIFTIRGIGDPIGESAATRAMEICVGLAFLGSGISLAFYWKRVKGIVRNPARAFFQNGLNQLNFYFLAACILSAVRIIFLMFGLY